MWNVRLVMGGRWLGQYFEQSQQWLDWIVIGGLALGVGRLLSVAGW